MLKAHTNKKWPKRLCLPSLSKNFFGPLRVA